MLEYYCFTLFVFFLLLLLMLFAYWLFIVKRLERERRKNEGVSEYLLGFSNILNEFSRQLEEMKAMESKQPDKYGAAHDDNIEQTPKRKRGRPRKTIEERDEAGSNDSLNEDKSNDEPEEAAESPPTPNKMDLIIELHLQGLTVKQIAKQLEISSAEVGLALDMLNKPGQIDESIIQ